MQYFVDVLVTVSVEAETPRQAAAHAETLVYERTHECEWYAEADSQEVRDEGGNVVAIGGWTTFGE